LLLKINKINEKNADMKHHQETDKCNYLKIKISLKVFTLKIKEK